MRSSSLTAATFMFLVALAACRQGDQPPAPAAAAELETAAAPPATTAAAEAPQKPAKKNAPAQGTADLQLTGAITKELRGPIVTCGYTRMNGRDQGGTWAIRGDEFDFQIMALSDEELSAPAAVLNAREPARVSYVFKRKAGKLTAAADRTIAEIDADLQDVVGRDVVHVKGTLTCPPK